MSGDLELLDGISLFLSKDTIHYEPILELKKSALQLAYNNNGSIIKIISNLLENAGTIISEGFFHSYSLQLQVSGSTFFISDKFISSRQQRHEVVKLISVIDLSENQLIYNSLTNRERQILCFLARGYKQSIISFVLHIGIETFKSHRKSLYTKMDFKSKADLNTWAEKYLELYFRRKD
jgi:DNA-binding CsgD family transcriptional regulator